MRIVRRSQMLARMLAVLAFTGLALSRAEAQSFTFTLKTGHGEVGTQDAAVWVQGAPFPFEPPGYVSSGLPLQHPIVVPTNAFWGDLEGAHWVSPAPNGTGAP